MTGESDIVETLRRAITAHRHGLLDEAAAVYDEVLARDSANTEALRLSGVLARQQGDLALSAIRLEAAVRAAPRDVTAINDLALTRMACGDLYGAELALREALNISPQSTRSLANLGALLQQRGHLVEAVSVYRRCLDVQPDDLEVRCNLANALMDAGRAQDSVEAADAALEIAPGHPMLLANKGAVLCGLDRCVEAIEVLDEALALNPGDEMALINLAYAQRSRGDDHAAIGTLTRAVHLGPDNARAHADLANLLLATGHAQRAVEVCERFLMAFPGERMVLATFGFALRDAGRVEDSRPVLDYEQLVRVRDIKVPSGFAGLEEFNAGLRDFVTSHPSLLADPVRKSTTGGAQTGELNTAESRVFDAFERAVHDEVAGVIAELVAEGLGGHDVMAYAAEEWTLRTWGTVLSAGGHQSPHQHPLGWLSGVYYVSMPDDRGDIGVLEFGTPPDRIRTVEPPETRIVEPSPGRLVIFPSWFYHRTMPFAAPGTRVSLAFDVMPLA